MDTKINEEVVVTIPAYKRISFSGGKKVCVLLEGLVRVKNKECIETIGPGGVFYSNPEACALIESRILAFDLEQLSSEQPELAEKIMRKLQGSDTPGLKNLEPLNDLSYVKTVECPVCNIQFQTLNLFSYKLKHTGQDPDLRQHYEKIEPLYYDIWACPSCYYANFSEEFLSLSESEKNLLQSHIEERSKGSHDHLGEPGSIVYACESHHLAIECLNLIDADTLKIAGIWLRLAWIYSDQDQEDMSKSARQKALDYYLETYTGKSSMHLNNKKVQQILYLIGELSWNLGDSKKALEFFMKFMHCRDKNPRLVDLAQDCIQQIRLSAQSEAIN